MPEHDALVDAYQHLENLPRAADALHTLRKISSLVKPIMRKRNWRVGTLKEFFPDQQNLLGLNVDRGRSICLRLRHAGDKQQFLPLEDVVDTMLHELSHNVHGPHDEKFHMLWNKLRDEYMDLKMKGYSGEGFLSDGHRLGGRRVPMNELRRNARAEAEKRKARQILHSGSGQKVGGAPVLRGLDMRDIIANAVTRRINITKGCASGTSGADQVSKEADRNGFRTKAEEDDANERAIAQALWELVQEEEARSVGVEPQQTSIPLDFTSIDEQKDQRNASTQGKSRMMSPNTSRSRSASPERATLAGQNLDDHRQPPNSAYPLNRKRSKVLPGTRRPQSRLISEDEAKRRSASYVDLTSTEHDGSKKGMLSTTNPPSDSLESSIPATWSCNICTLINPINFLCCDACGSLRPASTTASMLSNTPKVEGETRMARLGWNCSNCGSWHEHQWWTCSNCGLLKNSSV